MHKVTKQRRDSPLPHKVRSLSKHNPHHVVLSVRDDVPPLHRRKIREIFNQVQAETANRYPIAFNAGSIMCDHVHLLIESCGRVKEFSNAMRFLTSKFALAVNQAFGRRGAVFKDRYFSRILNTVSELVQVLRYVSMNPVKAGLCAHPAHWPDSSSQALMNPKPSLGPWSFWGWMYRVLGFDRDPKEALRKILSGETRAVRPGRGRQLRLPFERGVPPAVRPSVRQPPRKDAVLVAPVGKAA